MNKTRIEFFKQGYRKDLLRELTKNINQNESITILGMPGVGVSSLVSYLETEDFLERYFVNKNTLILKLDLNNLLEVNLINFYRYFFKSIVTRIKDSNNISDEIKAEVKEIYTNNIKEIDTFILYEELKSLIENLADQDYKLVIILDEFIKLRDVGKIAFNNLKAIRDINKEAVSMFFIGSQNLPELMAPDILEGLYTIFRYKFVYITPPEIEEIHYIIKEQEDKFKIKIEQKQVDIIYKISGGNLWYIKKIISILSDEKSELDLPLNEIIANISEKYEIEMASEYLWNKLGEQDQEEITSLVKGVKQKTKNEYLLKSGLVSQNSGSNHKLFSPLFEAYVKRIKNIGIGNSTSEYSVNTETRTILCNNKKVGEDLTKTEFNVLAYFIQNAGTISSRDDIAKIMWGSDFYDSYSDYAIDRLISRIRKKIGEDASAPKHLKTIKGVGFRFE